MFNKNLVLRLLIVIFMIISSVASGTDNLAVKIVYLMLPLTIIIFILYIRLYLTFYLTNYVFLFFNIIVLTSILWSNYFHFTVLFVVKYFVFTQMAIFMSIKFKNPDNLIVTVKMFFIFTMVISLVGSIVYPSFFVHNEYNFYGNWKGIFGHKNVLGTISLLAVTLFVYLIFYCKEKKIRNVAFLIISLLNLLFSKSATALVLLIFLLSIWGGVYLINYLKKKNIYLMLTISTVVTMLFLTTVLFVTSNYVEIVELLGRDPTLSGRTNIYMYSLTAIQDRLWLGYGLGGFWMDAEKASYIWRNIGFVITSSHSGILDTLLDIGFIGLTFLVLHLGVTLKRIIALCRKKKKYAYWFLCLYIVLVFYNITDSRLLNTSGIYWLLYVSIAASVSFNRKHLIKYKN